MNIKYNLKTILSGAMLTLCLASCNPLGIEPTTMVDEDRFWENPALARSYVNQFYLWAPAAANDRFVSDQWSDDGMSWLDGQYANFNCQSFIRRQYDAITDINSFKISDLWKNAYKHIRATNLGIEKISSSNVLEVPLQKQLLAESYFFRAWCYFEMEQYFGTVPYLNKTLTAQDETMIPRVTREKLFDNILSDLTEAYRLFTESGRTPEVGMINKYAVQTFKSRVALYAACAASASAKNLHNTGESASLFKFSKTDKDYYQIAFESAGEVLGKFQLEDKYATLFTSNTVSTKESIWPMMFNLSSRSGFNPTGWLAPLGQYYDSDLSWDFWGGIFPTQDLVDCYYQKDKADGKWKQWWKTQQAQEMGGVVDAEGNFKGSANDYRDLMYTDRDDRFYATITYDGSYLCPNTQSNRNMYIIQTWVDDITSEEGKEMKYSALHTGYRNTANFTINTSGRAGSYTGYYLRKYAHYDKFDSDGKLNRDQRTTCYYMLRYAEVLLNYAEAAIKLDKSDLAKTRIQEIRNRAGITEEFNEATAGHNLWEEYKLQRHLEFAFEVPGHRYYDLLRWNEAEGNTTIAELNRGPKAIRIHRKGVVYDATDANPETKKKVGYPLLTTDPGYITPKVETLRYVYSEHLKKFNNPRYYFFPILETIKTGYRGMTQNPGWESFNKE